MADLLGPAGIIILSFIGAVVAITGTYFVTRLRRRLARLSQKGAPSACGQAAE
ncbi:MAG: hypothetical protein AAGJ73_05370 [Pseudomonadota bacterium]